MRPARHPAGLLLLFLFLFLFLFWLPLLASAPDRLRVLTWPGYADPDVVAAFERRTGARVEVTYIDSDQALWQRIAPNQGADFDLFAVNTAELQRYIDAGLVAPINPEAIPRLAHQLPAFRQLDRLSGIVRDGRVYAIPYTYAEMGLIYDRARITQPPDSIAALWDPRYRGRVLAYNGATHNVSLAALALGMATPFRIADADWPMIVERLIALRRNVLTFYTQPEESVALFRRHEVALLFANYGSQQLKLLQAAGVDVGYAIPKEGALAWLDGWAITREARHPALAHAWIDYLLEPEPGAVLLRRHGLANTQTPSPFHQSNDRLLWLEPVEDAARRAQLWERILSGDRASRVLAP